MKKLNLQLFANNDETETVEETQEIEETQEQESKETQEFDINKILEHPEFQKYINSYADKRVTSALQKKEKEYQAKLEEEKRRANMTAEELQQEKERELAERERQLKQYELKLAKLDYFKEKGYNIELLDYVNGSDKEEIKDNTDKLIEVVNKLVEKQVAERLKQNAYTPPKGGDTQDKLTLEDLSNMSVEEINKYWEKLKKQSNINKI